MHHAWEYRPGWGCKTRRRLNYIAFRPKAKAAGGVTNEHLPNIMKITANLIIYYLSLAVLISLLLKMLVLALLAR